MKRFWSGENITTLLPNQVFVFGSNPEGRHGKGAARHAMKFGATYGQGRGLSGQSYAVVTKNLKPNCIENGTGYLYVKTGLRSLSLDQIRFNVQELYALAELRPGLDFLVIYKNDEQESLCGYSSKQLVTQCFLSQPVPDNIVFHDSFSEQLL